jgi:hypothetical protein
LQRIEMALGSRFVATARTQGHRRSSQHMHAIGIDQRTFAAEDLHTIYNINLSISLANWLAAAHLLLQAYCYSHYLFAHAEDTSATAPPVMNDHEAIQNIGNGLIYRVSSAGCTDGIQAINRQWLAVGTKPLIQRQYP